MFAAFVHSLGRAWGRGLTNLGIGEQFQGPVRSNLTVCAALGPVSRGGRQAGIARWLSFFLNRQHLIPPSLLFKQGRGHLRVA